MCMTNTCAEFPAAEAVVGLTWGWLQSVYMLHDAHERHILSAMLWLLWVLLHLCLCVVAHLMHPELICKVDRMLRTPV